MCRSRAGAHAVVVAGPESRIAILTRAPQCFVQGVELGGSDVVRLGERGAEVAVLGLAVIGAGS